MPINHSAATVSMHLVAHRARRSVLVLAFALACLALAVLAGCSSGGGTASSASTSSTATVQTAPVTGKLAIIHTNDTHGYDKAAAATSATSSDGVLGMAAVAQLKSDYEAKGYQVILVDAGDATQDNNLVNLSKGATAIQFMNACGYDAMALGNHEFDWGADNLEALMPQAGFPMLAANIIVDATGQPYTQANTIITLADGGKVGVFGLDTPETKVSANPKYTEGLTFLEGNDLYACAQQQVDYLKSQGCSVVVCLGHLGEDEGLAGNRAVDIADHTSGIDVIIDGHDHKVENATENGVLIAETGSHLQNIGVVTYENGTFAEQLASYGSYTGQDAGVAAIVDTAAADVDAQMSQVVATSTVALDGVREDVRTKETNLGDLVTDSILWQAKQAQAADSDVDAAIINGGGIRASVPVGDITLNTVKSVQPYDNQLYVFKVTGAQLLEALEAACCATPDALGGFPQVSGITFTVDTSVAYAPGSQYPDSSYYAPANPGSRVTITDVGGKGFSLDQTYTLASIEFICYGGDTYYSFAEASSTTAQSIGYMDYEAFENYLVSEMGGTVGAAYAQPQGRITIK